MKKVISVLLAVLMCFSMFTVCFAAEETTEESTPTIDTDELLNEACQWALGMSYDEFNALDDDAKWQAIQNMDMEKVVTLVKVAKPVLKFAKIAIKLILVLDKFGIVDLSGIKASITDMIIDAIVGAIEDGQISIPTEEQTA